MARLLRRPVVVAASLLALAVGVRFFTSVYPLFHAVYLSLFEINPIARVDRFVGFANYFNLVSDIIIRESVSYTLIFTIASTVLQLGGGLAIALLLNASFRGRQLARTANLIPWAIPTMVAAIAFRWMFDDQYGIITDLFSRVTGVHAAWLANAWGARIALILTNVWKNAPFLAVVFLAALQGVPTEVYEAAKVDGAGAFRSFRYITLPLISPFVTTMALFFVIWQLGAFDLIIGMTGGGPGFATSILAHRIYTHAFFFLNFGLASALGMMLFFLVAVVGVLGFALFRRQEVAL